MRRGQCATELAAAAAILLSAQVAWCRNVDLSTVPTRATVQLTIYNSEDLTLVRETRKVTFKKGSNPLQFSWAGTLIDPTSVELRFLTQPDELSVVDTTFPHDKPQMLYWNVDSEFDGEATIEITYFTSGITWSADYVCIANHAETSLNLESFVRVTNRSGEDYENAQVRLVVGTINLVEKIAQLARVSIDEVEQLEERSKNSLRKKAIRALAQTAPADAKKEGEADEENAEKQIIKEGLSEYFIYTVEGTETVRHGWSKRMRSFEAEEIPLKIEYRYRPQQYGEQLVRMYLLTNDEKSKLGTTPLPDGMVRVFRHNGRDGLSYVTQQPTKYIPIGDKIEINLGVDPKVRFELVKFRASRDDIWLKLHGLNLYRHLDGKAVIEPNASVAGWTEHEIFAQRVRNYTDRAINVEVRRSFAGDVRFRSSLEPKLHDYQTPEFKAAIPAGQKRDLLFEIVRRQGHNAVQHRVELESAVVTR